MSASDLAASGSMHLVTSSRLDLRLEPIEVNLLLDSTCLTFEEQETDRGIAPKVVDVPLRDPCELDAMWREILDFENIYFPHLTRAFNTFHEKTFTERQIRILLGPWLRMLLNTLAARSHLLEYAFEHFDISSYSTFELTEREYTPYDTEESAWSVVDNVLSSWLYGEIIDFNYKNVKNYPKVEMVSPIQIVSITPKQSRPFRSGRKFGLRKLVRYSAGCIMRSFHRATDSVFFDVHIPFRMSSITQLMMHQIPLEPSLMLNSRERSFNERSEVDTTARSDFAKLLPSAPTGFDSLVLHFIPKLLPSIFLEDFNKSVEFVCGWSLPKTPKLIVTSVAFWLDDLFKIWLIDKIAKGSKYVVIQHGNNYGSHRWLTPYVEETTPDAFVSWGWDRSVSEVYAGFKLSRTTGMKRKESNDKLVLQENCPPFGNLIYWQDSDYQSYFIDQERFVNELNPELRDALQIRLHSGSKKLPYPEEELWKSRIPNVNLDLGVKPVVEIWSRSRIIVHSYDSTGLLETLGMGLPSVAFWAGGLAHVLPDQRCWYKPLEDVGIIHSNPISAAHHINRYWNDIDSWWLDPTVITARDNFVRYFARPSAEPHRDLFRVLTNIAEVPSEPSGYNI